MRPRWINDDGNHVPEAFDDALRESGARVAEQTEAVQAAMQSHPGKAVAPTDRYVPHPDGTAHDRWQRSNSGQSFDEWCVGNVPRRGR